MRESSKMCILKKFNLDINVQLKLGRSWGLLLNLTEFIIRNYTRLFFGIFL